MEFNQVIQRLKNKKYKITPQRKEIIKCILTDREHPNAYEIFNKVRLKKPKISKSTIYYTLNMLKKEGLIREIDFYDRPNRYDATVEKHINLICLQCYKIIDYMDIPAISLENIELETGFRPENARFELYGYCDRCKRDK